MSEETVPDLLKPEQVFAGRYRIVRFLAKGGMGAVFVGEHTATEQRVAIKVLWPNVLASKSAVEKFQLEAKVAGRVRSDNIVQVIDAGFDAETSMPFLVMELLEGKNLEHAVLADGPLAPATLLAYMTQVASGLDRAHSYSKDGAVTPIVHRDLKPENLFLARRDDGSPLVKILDFGIAKVVSEGTKMSREVKGTPLFMAYEQATGGKVGPWTDIWALGLIVFWLLSGKHYWRTAEDEEATITALFAEVLTMELVPATQRIQEHGRLPPWPLAFDAWFARCVDRDPSRRFPSAGAAVVALAEALGLPPPSLAVPALASLELPPPSAASRPVVASSAMTQSVAGLAHTQPSAQPLPAKGGSKTLIGALVGLIAVLAVGAIFLYRNTSGQVAPTTSLVPDPSAVPLAQPDPPPEVSANLPAVELAAPSSSGASQVASAPRSPTLPPALKGGGKPAAGGQKPPNKPDKDTYGSR